MNRRSFLSSILKAGIGAAILPSALTYARQWKTTPAGILYEGVPIIWDRSFLYECHLPFWNSYLGTTDEALIIPAIFPPNMGEVKQFINPPKP